MLALKTGEMEPPKASCFLCCKRRVRVWQSTVNQREDGKSECLKHLWVKFPPLGYYGTYMIFNEEGKHADMYLKKNNIVQTTYTFGKSINIFGVEKSIKGKIILILMFMYMCSLVTALHLI